MAFTVVAIVISAVVWLYLSRIIIRDFRDAGLRVQEEALQGEVGQAYTIPDEQGVSEGTEGTATYSLQDIVPSLDRTTLRWVLRRTWVVMGVVVAVTVGGILSGVVLGIPWIGVLVMGVGYTLTGGLVVFWIGKLRSVSDKRMSDDAKFEEIVANFDLTA